MWCNGRQCSCLLLPALMSTTPESKLGNCTDTCMYLLVDVKIYSCASAVFNQPGNCDRLPLCSFSLSLSLSLTLFRSLFPRCVKIDHDEHIIHPSPRRSTPHHHLLLLLLLLLLPPPLAAPKKVAHWSVELHCRRCCRVMDEQTQ